MIPVALRLENFLSYRQAGPIDFTSFGVACLTGSNGQGKSSLLDAMTWALFGCARGCEGGQNQERLIRDGADRATVEFTFELGGTEYRIVRNRGRTKGADLQFMVRSGESWTNLAAETLRETESRIEQVLRMDYRTFVTSAFLLQGHADDFLTRMKPEDRKDVFARLLDLGTYERLEEASRAHARDAEVRRKEHATAAERLTAECAELPAVEAGLAEAEAAAAAAQQALADAERDAAARAQELARIEATVEHVRAERTAIGELDTRLAEDRRTLEAKAQEIRELDALLSREREVRAALAEAEELAARQTELQEAERALAALETRRAELTGVIDAERSRITERTREREARAAAVGRELQALAALETEAAAMRERLRESEAARAGAEETRAHIAALREEHASLTERLAGLAQREGELAERRELLARGEGACPVCDGKLDEEHRRTLLCDTDAALAALAAERTAVGSRREDVEKEGKRLREDEQRLVRTVAAHDELARTLAEAEGRLERMASLRAESEQLAAGIAADAVLLAEEAFAAEARAGLAGLEARIGSLAYDPAAHATVRARLDELAAFRALAGKLEAAASRREAAGAERDALAHRIEQDELAAARRREALATLERAAAGEPEVREALARATAAVERARGQATSAAGETVRLAERLEGLRRLTEQLQTERDAEAAAAASKRRYTRLAQAFGRGGIPDLIIENALPELTQDANDVLARLTDCEMSLQFSMGRLTKSGKSKETFDVLVDYDGCVRDYSMFSGGEAFRIAFAIRLALSKLLVRRAGARLETLVIDEGFGTQDAEGRERLLEAINLARADFAKVLVITHLDELKDAFGAQIRVSKTPRDGSTVQVAAG